VVVIPVTFNSFKFAVSKVRSSKLMSPVTLRSPMTVSAVTPVLTPPSTVDIPVI